MGMRRFIRHWWVAARHGVGGNMFGWGIVAGGSILGYSPK